MNIDLSQFHQVFIEESFEGLGEMESALMALDPDSIDDEMINTIFRSAHSIKGGSATFGFSAITDFTHVLETLLDQIRSGTRSMSSSDVNLFLKSVDCMRQLLSLIDNGESSATEQSLSLKLQFEHILNSNSEDSEPKISSDSQAPKQGSSSRVWMIHFVPNKEILRTGNDPVRIFHALEDMGEVSVQLENISMPSFMEFDPELLYVSWMVTLTTLHSKDEILEQFEWVEDEATISISELSGTQAENSDLEQISESNNDKSYSEDLSGPERSTLEADSVQASATKAKALKKSPGTESTSIRVGIDKIDTLINMVGELVITQSMLGQLGADFDSSQVPKLIEGLNQLEQNTRELQESVMRIRMIPISFAFSRFPRMVRDLGQQLNKKINLNMLGDQTELDKTVMEKIGDPLVHLVRNAIDHGIETAEVRKAAGKPETGNIVLNAYHSSGNVVIEIQDDGKGLDRDSLVKKAIEKDMITVADAKQFTDEQVYDLIFQPGFSTATVVSDVSGRGVGMDVVRKNIQTLNGAVEIQSTKGHGSKILIRLPLTLAILDGQLVQVGNEVFVFPLVSIVESIQCKKNMVNHIAGGCQVFKLRDEYIPIIRLDEAYGRCGAIVDNDLDNSLMVVVENEREKFGIVVDELLAQQQVVIKSLEQNYRRIEGVSGATILGDGKVALIIDIPGVVKLAGVAGASRIINEDLVDQGLVGSTVSHSGLYTDGPRLQA